MITKRSLIALTSFFFLCAFLDQTALGQIKLDSCEKIKDSTDVSLLGTTSVELISAIQGAEADLKDSQSELTLTTPENQLKTELDNLNKKTSKTDADEARIRQLTSIMQRTKELNERIATGKKDLEDKRDLVRCIQQRLSKMYSPEQNFKLWMSITFAALIGFVILGFFVLSFIDESMRRKIFAGQTGIQFLTLFSIVIAIILFGITGILADKELAALLGGISGYILGRSSTASQRDDAPEPSFLARLASISISPASLQLTAAAPSSQLTITAKDKSGNVLKDDGAIFKPVWISSNPTVATVNQSGLVTRVAVGTCNISASFNNITSNTCVVTCS